MPAKPRWFSAIFSPLRHHPKHCASLVVQPGFPTSLIDIFVKNQDRLKNPSRCKKSKKNSAHIGVTRINTKQGYYDVPAGDVAPPPTSRSSLVASEIKVPEFPRSGIVDSDSEFCGLACRSSEIGAFESEIRAPACRSSEFADFESGIRVPACRRSEIRVPTFRGSEIASSTSEIKIPNSRNSNSGGELSMRRLLEMWITVSIIAVFLLSTKRTAIAIAITLLVFPFSRSLRWFSCVWRHPTPVNGNLVGEERHEDEIKHVLPHVEDIKEMEAINTTETIVFENPSDDYTRHKVEHSKTTTGGRGRRAGLKSKLLKLVHRKPSKSKKLKNPIDQESIGECKTHSDEEEATGSEYGCRESYMPTEVIRNRENDRTGFLIVLAIVLGGLCLGHTAAMAVTVTWFVTIEWWMYFISRCKRR